MATAVKRQRVEREPAASQAAQKKSVKFQDFYRDIHVKISSFLGLEGTLTAKRVCQSLNRNLSGEQVWKQFIQQRFPEVALPTGTAKRERYKELSDAVQKNIREGKFSLSEFHFDKDNVRVETSKEVTSRPISTAHLHPISNCFITNFKKSELPDTPYTQCDAYDFSGAMLCTLDLSKLALSSPRTFILSYATATELFLIAHPVDNKSATCARFSRPKGSKGSLLRSFTFPYARSAFNTQEVVGISFLVRRIILHDDRRKEHRYTVMNFRGKVVEKYKFARELLPKFSAKTSSIFYLQGSTLCEKPIGQKSRPRFDIPRWTYNPMNLHGAATTEGFVANDRLIAAFSDRGEVRLWDYTSGALLSTIQPAYENIALEYAIGYTTPISGLSLLRDQVAVNFYRDLLNDREAEALQSRRTRIVLYDRSGKEVLRTFLSFPGSVLFPLWESSILEAQYRDGATSDFVGTINNTSGKSVGKFEFRDMTFGVSCHSFCGRKIALVYSNHVKILDYGPKSAP